MRVVDGLGKGEVSAFARTVIMRVLTPNSRFTNGAEKLGLMVSKPLLVANDAPPNRSRQTTGMLPKSEP